MIAAWIEKSGHPQAIRIAQKAIKLLQQKIARDYGELKIGAELEFRAPRNEDESTGNEFCKIPPSEIWKAFGSHQPMATKEEKHGIGWLDDSRYISGLYSEEILAQSLELVFGHEAKHINPLRLAGAVENAKARLHNSFRGRRIDFSPVVSDEGINFHQSLQISFSILRNDKNLIPYVKEAKREHILGMQPVLAETALFWAPDRASLKRLHNISAGSKSYSVDNAIQRSDERTEVRLGSARANAYLVMVSLLAGIVYTGENKSQQLPSDRTLVATTATPEELLLKLKNSEKFRKVLNDLSPERLGDLLIAAINSPQQAISEGKTQRLR